MAKRQDEPQVEEMVEEQVEEVVEAEAEAPADETVSVPASVLQSLMAEIQSLKEEVKAAKTQADESMSHLRSVGLAAREVAAVKREPRTYEINDGIIRTDN